MPAVHQWSEEMPPACHPLRLLLAASATMPALANAHDNSVVSTVSGNWSADPWVLVPLLLSGMLYAAGLIRLWSNAGIGAGLRPWHAGAFMLAWITSCLALLSPLHAMSEMLFSAHMVQHQLLMLIAAPLFVISKPLPAWLWALPARWRQPARDTATRQPAAMVWRICSRPLIAWMLHAAAIWIWHVPALYQAASTDRFLHILQHLAFLLSALLFWQAVLDRRHGLARTAAGVVYIFTTMVHTGLLGALLTFSRTVWYPIYSSNAAGWGMTPLEDQQLGGLAMWIPGGLIYLAVTLMLAARWLRELEKRQRRTDFLVTERD